MSERSSKWAFIVYPDSAPTDWLKILKLSFVSFAVSPLHSPDPDGSGDERKQHWHVLMDFDSLKSQEQVSKIIYVTNGTKPVIINNPSGYYQYMIHLNNPEKEQFINGFDAIEKYNGFNGDKYEKYSEKQLDAIFTDITNIIDENNINEYYQLIELIKNPEYDKQEYLRIIRHNTIFFNTYISSRRNMLKKKEVLDINKRIEIIERKIKASENIKNE